jgi:hypothetical protein
MSFDKSAFEGFVASLGLKHFNADELLVGRYRSKNGPPPLTHWHNIAPTIVVLDTLRAELGQSVKLVSVYRTEAYNDPANNPGREPKSQHQAFTAIDFQVSGVKPDDVKAKLRAWESSRWFHCPLAFERKGTKVSAGTIPFGELPRKVSLGSFGCWFTYRGYVKAYGVSFTHFDTRGITSTTPAL